jgi:hypothetical protein
METQELIKNKGEAAKKKKKKKSEREYKKNKAHSQT